jgi:glutamate/aspartate transport system permease protein
MLGLDLSFFNWSLIGPYVVKGFWFSIQLTIIATIGGIALGTVLALMRLSGKKWLETPAAIYVNHRQTDGR